MIVAAEMYDFRFVNCPKLLIRFYNVAMIVACQDINVADINLTYKILFCFSHYKTLARKMHGKVAAPEYPGLAQILCLADQMALAKKSRTPDLLYHAYCYPNQTGYSMQAAYGASGVQIVDDYRSDEFTYAQVQGPYGQMVNTIVPINNPQDQTAQALLQTVYTFMGMGQGGSQTIRYLGQNHAVISRAINYYFRLMKNGLDREAVLCLADYMREIAILYKQVITSKGALPIHLEDDMFRLTAAAASNYAGKLGYTSMQRYANQRIPQNQDTKDLNYIHGQDGIITVITSSIYPELSGDDKKYITLLPLMMVLMERYPSKDPDISELSAPYEADAQNLGNKSYGSYTPSLPTIQKVGAGGGYYTTKANYELEMGKVKMENVDPTLNTDSDQRLFQAYTQTIAMPDIVPWHDLKPPPTKKTGPRR